MCDQITKKGKSYVAKLFLKDKEVNCTIEDTVVK